MDEKYGRKSLYVMLSVIVIILLLGGSISIYFSKLMNDFLFEQKIEPQVKHTQVDASLDLPAEAFEDAENPEYKEIFEYILIDAQSQANIPRMDAFNKEQQVIWSSSQTEIKHDNKRLAQALAGKSSFKNSDISLLEEFDVESLMEIYVPIYLVEGEVHGEGEPSEEAGHEEGEPHDESAETKERREAEAKLIQESGEVIGVIKIYLDDSELRQLTKKLNIEIWLMTFSTIILITSVLFFVFRKQNSYLIAANKKIARMLELKTEFMNQAAHDLRTPLTPILTLLPIVEKNAKSSKDKKSISVIKNNANYLSKIVENLITLIKTEAASQPHNPEDIKLQELIEEIVSNSEVSFSKKGIKVMNDVPQDLPVVSIDRNAMTEVFHNIISNTIKFTDKGGTLTINAKKDKDSVTVEFTDTGKGMSNETLSRLFEGFYKADESRHRMGGSGLGLLICKRIMGAHNGTIKAESEGLGKGSTIILNIPADVKP